MKRAIITLVTLAVLITGGLLVAKSLRGGTGKDQNQYRTAKVEKGKVRKTVTATGVLKPWTTVDIRSRAGGRVVSYGPDLGKGTEGAPSQIEEGSMVKKGAILVQIDPSDVLLTYNSARADIQSNQARVDQTRRELELQQEQTEVSIQNAKASLRASEASASAAKARAESAMKQSEAQKELTDSTIASATATLQAETERLDQIKKTTRLVQTASAQAALNQAAANLKNAEVQLKRQTALLEKGFIAESQVDQAQATFGVAQATYDSARVRLDTINPDVESDIRAQAARVDQVKASLRTAEANRVDVRLRQESALAARADYQRSLADIDQARVAVRQAESNRFNTMIRRTQILQAQASGARANASMVNAQVQLDETRVTAPSDGIVLKKYIEPGTLISSGISFNSTGTNIVQFGDTTRMYVDVQVDETDVASVDLDQKVDITFDAYPTTPFSGKVIKVDPQAVIEQNVTTVHVRVEVDNSETTFTLLKPGMNASCEFIVSEVDDVVMVPNEALKNDSDGTRYVELGSGGKPAPADKDGEKDETLLIEVKVTKQKLTAEDIGLEGNDSTEIKGGLKGGETILTQTIEPAAPSAGGSPFGGGGRGPARR